MDTKKLDECIEELKYLTNSNVTVQTKYIKDKLQTALSLAIQVRAGKLVEPMNEKEIKEIIESNSVCLNPYDDFKKQYGVYPDTLSTLIKVGKLSTPRLICRNCGTEKNIRNSLGELDCACGQQDMTKINEPRLTDWEKILQKKKKIIHIEDHKICAEYTISAIKEFENQAIDDCLSALKSMNEPRLTEDKVDEILNHPTYKLRMALDKIHSLCLLDTSALCLIDDIKKISSDALKDEPRLMEECPDCGLGKGGECR